MTDENECLRCGHDMGMHWDIREPRGRYHKLACAVCGGIDGPCE